MASSLLPSSLRLRLISIIRSPNLNNFRGAGRMMSTAENNSPPWLMLPPALESDGMVYNFYSLAQKKVRSFNDNNNNKSRCAYRKEPTRQYDNDSTEIVGSSHGWLAFYNWRNCDLFLLNPLTRRHVSLPPIRSLPIAQEDLKCGVSKLIISCNDVGSEDCRAMMIFAIDRLAFCCPGRSTEWTPIGAVRRPPPNQIDARCYEDIVYSSREKLFFCLTDIDCYDLEGWDVTAPNSPRLRWSNQNDLLGFGDHGYIGWYHRAEDSLYLSTHQLRHLVFAEQAQQLFLVTRHLVEQMGPDGSSVEDSDTTDDYPYKTVAFDVHKIDREEGGGGKLSYMEGGSLDGLAMFVGLNHSFAMSAAEYDHLKPNSIYFTDDRQLTPPNWCADEMYGGHDIGIFDYENRTISSCYYPCDIQSLKRIKPAPVWFTPALH